MSAIFIGHKTVVIPNVSDFVVEPRAPKNYKDQTKINEYIEEAKQEIRNSSSFKPFTGMVEELSISIDDEEGICDTATGYKDYKTYRGAADLASFLDDLEKALDADMQAFTFQAYTFMRIISMQAIKQGIKSRLVNDWILNHPKARGLIVDLPKVFLPSTEEVNRIGYFNMFNYFGVAFSSEHMNNTVSQCRKLYELYVAANKFHGRKVVEVAGA